MAFCVGQKVVCVDAGPTPGFPEGGWCGDVPIEGRVYTIDAIVTVYDGRQGLRLCEIRNIPLWECSYAAWRFRPVVERKTDISIFTRMLTDEKMKERV